MGWYIFDFDGTLANINHRLNFLETKNWDGFFEACDQDEPILDVIGILKHLKEAGHNVEIWSGRSAKVEEKSLKWLDEHLGSFYQETMVSTFGASDGIDIPYSSLLTHMRPEGDFRPDTVLKEEWLHAFHQEHGFFPDMIFDDRPSVVEMWRKNGVTCAQVATWDDRKRCIPPLNERETQFFIMVGPSGAGKSTWIKDRFKPSEVVSSDELREELSGNFKSQERNKDVFEAIDYLVTARLKSGLRCVVDATNLRAKDRKHFVGLAREINPEMKIEYVVVDRPLQEKHDTAGWRENVTVGNDTTPLIEVHHQRFQAVQKDVLNGDGLGIKVTDARRI